MTATSRLEDKDAVRNLMARQKFAADDRDGDRVTRCWARVARLELDFRQNLPVVREGREVIMATTLEIIDEPDGGIRAMSYCQYLASHGSMATHGCGPYRDTFVFEGSAGRIASRRVGISAVFE